MASSIETNNNTSSEDPINYANSIVTSIGLPLAVRSAIDIGIFNILAKIEKLSAQDIAFKIGSKNPEAPMMLDRLLKLLASHSMLYCSLSEDQQQHGSPQILYSLSPVSEYFVTDPNGVSFEPVLNFFLDRVTTESWSGLKGAIMEGGLPFNRVHGMNIYEYAGVNPKFNDKFNKAMVTFSTTVMKRFVECYKGFDHINTLVDVAGGIGINLKLITSKYSHIQGVNFDLPHVLENAQTNAGVTHVGGDMFESVPKGDAIFMKWILHNWNDEYCLKLLKNCYKAIPNNGKVIVLEYILPISPDDTFNSKESFLCDIYMMIQQDGGKERTKNEFSKLALESGFNGIKFVTCISGMWVMEFFK